MALRVRSDDTVVCAAEEPPMLGDVYIDDRLHGLLGEHFQEPTAYRDENPGLCWQCKETPDLDCIRCGPRGLNLHAKPAAPEGTSHA